jgi:hypothetical protein
MAIQPDVLRRAQLARAEYLNGWKDPPRVHKSRLQQSIALIHDWQSPELVIAQHTMWHVSVLNSVSERKPSAEALQVKFATGHT